MILVLIFFGVGLYLIASGITPLCCMPDYPILLAIGSITIGVILIVLGIAIIIDLSDPFKHLE